jgi:hypothetical protein
LAIVDCKIHPKNTDTHGLSRTGTEIMDPVDEVDKVDELDGMDEMNND